MDMLKLYDEIMCDAYAMMERRCPFLDEMTRDSAVNRIAEFVHDLSVEVEDAEKFIEDPHGDAFGVVLEFWDNENKRWSPCEMNDGAVLFDQFDFDDYCDSEIRVGLYANWGECWGDCEADDWGYRLGAWESLPTEERPDDVYGRTESRGGCGMDGEWYRLRRVPLGPYSEKAKRWMHENIHLFKSVKEKRLGGI